MIEFGLETNLNDIPLRRAVQPKRLEETASADRVIHVDDLILTVSQRHRLKL